MKLTRFFIGLSVLTTSLQAQDLQKEQQTGNVSLKEDNNFKDIWFAYSKVCLWWDGELLSVSFIFLHVIGKHTTEIIDLFIDQCDIGKLYIYSFCDFAYASAGNQRPTDMGGIFCISYHECG